MTEEKVQEDEVVGAKKLHEAMNKFPKICEEYAKINSIELSPLSGYGTEHLKDMYNLLNDTKFIDFAFDEYGIAYNEKMFRVPPIPDYLEYKIDRHGFKLTHPKNAIPADHGELVSFKVRNAPKEEFGKINIYSSVLVNITPDEWLKRISRKVENRSIRSIKSIKSIKISNSSIVATEKIEDVQSEKLIIQN